MIDEQEYYIVQDGALTPVSEIRWRIWTEDNTGYLKVRETHLIKRGTPDIWGKVLTYFTGKDAYPNAAEKYLWKTKLFGGPPYMTLPHSSEETARKMHGGFVYGIVSQMLRDGIQLDAVEIDLSKITQETT
jgi:hypothetical protein